MFKNSKDIIRAFKFHDKHELRRVMSVQTSAKIQEDLFTSDVQRSEEWQNAKPYEDIPGPGKWTFPLSFIVGGRYHGLGLTDMHIKMREYYGPIFKLRGVFGRKDIIFTYNVEDFEKVYRTEGVWPERIGMETFTYYRKVVRPDVFQGLGGLVSEQGKAWADVRYKVNPILMKTQTIRYHLPVVDMISKEFISRIAKIRDPVTLEMPGNFGQEIRKWTFESICAIGLNKKLNLLISDKPDPRVLRLVDAMNAFFQLSYEFDVLPSYWKYYETPKFKKLMKVYDDITEITTFYINKTKEDFEAKGGNIENAESILEKLLTVDKRVAVVMAMDMLMAGIDTTSSAFTTLLYHIAKNPQKQERLRKEIMEILPEKDTPLTKENTINMPYLRACFKESLRIQSITAGNFRGTAQDLVLSGYRVPKNTGVIMGTWMSSNDEKYFSNTQEFLPERWLKRGEDACPAARAKHPFVYLPFGFGPRTCIGKRIAEMEIETMIARIIRNYRVSWEHPDMKYVSNLINIPIGDLKFKFADL